MNRKACLMIPKSKVSDYDRDNLPQQDVEKGGISVWGTDGWGGGGGGECLVRAGFVCEICTFLKPCE